MEKKLQLTTEAGAPVGDNEHIQTVGPQGPALLQNVWLLEKLAHFNRERIPERIVHAKGTGAFGTFTVEIFSENIEKSEIQGVKACFGGGIYGFLYIAVFFYKACECG